MMLTSADYIQLSIAVEGCITAISTVILAFFAIYQTIKIRREQIKWETIKACNLYDTDPVLTAASKHIYECARITDSHGNVTRRYTLDTMERCIQDIILIINYFDSLAIGVAQGVYLEEIIKANLKADIEETLDTFISAEFHKIIQAKHLNSLVQMRDRWVERVKPIR